MGMDVPKELWEHEDKNSKFILNGFLHFLDYELMSLITMIFSITFCSLSILIITDDRVISWEEFSGPKGENPMGDEL